MHAVKRCACSQEASTRANVFGVVTFEQPRRLRRAATEHIMAGRLLSLWLSLVLLLSQSAQDTFALDNGLGRLPGLGWNSDYCTNCSGSQAAIGLGASAGPN